MRTPILSRSISAFLFVLFFSAAASLSPARADDLVRVATYDNGGVKLVLATYAEKGKVVGLIGMTEGSTNVSFAFDRPDTANLLHLWQAAIDEHSASYVSKGSLAEVGTTAQCVLTAAGGPAVRLTIVDPIAGAVVFVVQPDDQADFDAKLHQVVAATN